MIKFVRKKLTRRLVLLLLIITVGLGIGAYYYWDSELSFPLAYSLIGLGVFFLLISAIICKLVNSPLRKLTKQMKLILTGHSYKRISTNRIDEIGIIAQFFNEITENLEIISKKLKEGGRMSDELSVASEIQQKLLPTESPQVPGLEVVTKTRPAVEIGGDSFDYISAKDSTYFYVGDVTGHGAPAALVMMMVNTLLHTYSEMYQSPYDIVVNTNKQLKPRIKSSMFMTMVLLKWDHLKQKMTYVGAGHEHILIYRAKTGEIESKESGGIALGMTPDNSKIVKEMGISLEKDDIVVLYTDGITEAQNNKGEMFGLERLIELVKKHATQYGPEGINHHVALDFSQFVGETEQADDITLMVLKYTGSQAAPQSAAPATAAQPAQPKAS
ncbi:PP2C family protein-serine/threonine phosphatase [Patescibacteria group bacterium]